MCVCDRGGGGRSERGWKTHMNKRQDKSFSCFSNILIFHECLFDVVLNIHVFMLRRKREMMQKKVIHSGTLCYMLWGTNILHTHTQTSSCTPQSHVLSLSL